MSIKKINSFMLVILLSIQMFVPLVSYADSPVSKDKHIAAMLYEIGVISDYAEKEKITKGEFVSYAATLLGGDMTVSHSAELPFKDVYKGHEFMNAICFGQNMKMFNNDWEYLYPDDEVTMYFATEVLSNTLRYNLVDYSSKLTMITDLTDGVKAVENNVLKPEMVYRILYNALNIPLVEQTVYGNNHQYYEIKEYTALEKYFQMTRKLGRVTATSTAAIYGGRTGRDEIRIDKTVYKTGGADYTDLIGHCVEFYSELNTQSKAISYIFKTGASETVAIEAENFGGFKNNTITYYENNRERQIKTESPIIIYNGEDVSGSEYTDTLFDVKCGSITAVSDANGVFDLIKIEAYENMLVGFVDTDEKRIYSENAGGVYFSYEDMRIGGVYLYDGESIVNADYTDIQKDSLITYKQSLNGIVTDIYISNVKLTSGIVRIDEYDDGRDALTLDDGGLYTLSGNVYKTGVDIGMKNKYIFYFNIFGEIGGVKNYISDELIYGFISAAGKESDISSNILFKMINTKSTDKDGNELLKAAKKVTVDGEIKSGQNIIDFIFNNNGGTTSVPVIYRLNSSGDINYIDTPYYNNGKEAEHTLTQRQHAAKFTTSINVTRPTGFKNVFGQRYFVPQDGLVVITPDNGDAPRRMAYIPSRDARTSGGYLPENVKPYSIGKDTVICPIAVWVDNVTQTESTTYEQKIYLVEKVYQTMNSEGVDATCITLSNNGNATEHLVQSDIVITDVSNVGIGDMVRASFNAVDEIDGLQIMLDGDNPTASAGKVYVHNTAADQGGSIYLMGNALRVAIGTVYDVEYDDTTGEYIVSYFLGGQDDMEAAPVLSTAQAYSVRRGNIKISDVTPSEIKTYKSANTEADVIMVRYEYNKPITQYFVSIGD